jgi:hypothetical protein
MWVHALNKLVGILLWGAWPVCGYCHDPECLDRTAAYNEQYGAYQDCLAGCYP